MKNLFRVCLAAGFVLTAFVFGSMSPGLVQGPFAGGVDIIPAVPAEYGSLYRFLENAIDRFQAKLAAMDSGRESTMIFGAELLPANCNRGEELLRPQTPFGVRFWLDKLKAMGVQGVTVAIQYPLYTPEFPRYPEYVAFYKQMAQDVRSRGMRLDVESNVLFANTEFSTVSVSYAGFDFERFKKSKRDEVRALIADLHPDYLNLGAEPDTAAALTGCAAFKDPKRYAEYVQFVLDGLDKGPTKIIAGIGSWGNLEQARELAAHTGIDCLDVHVYPVFAGCLDRILDIADIAARHGKGLVMDEAWLYKTERNLGSDNTAWTRIYGRDAYSFWQPLDQKFLAAMVAVARIRGIEYVSPFWCGNFFGYLDYTPALERLPYQQLRAALNRTQAQNMLAGKMSATGEFYQKLIADNSH